VLGFAGKPDQEAVRQLAVPSGEGVTALLVNEFDYGHRGA
jgi:hypothetical protein